MTVCVFMLAHSLAKVPRPQFNLSCADRGPQWPDPASDPVWASYALSLCTSIAHFELAQHLHLQLTDDNFCGPICWIIDAGCHRHLVQSDQDLPAIRIQRHRASRQLVVSCHSCSLLIRIQHNARRPRQHHTSLFGLLWRVHQHISYVNRINAHPFCV